MNVSICLATTLFALLTIQAADSPATPARDVSKLNGSFGIDRRVPWTSSRIIGSPEPPLPYQVKRVFPALKFTEPVDIAPIPGTDRLIVMEQKGKIFSFQNRPNSESDERDLFFDLRSNGRISSAYGITFHPGFQTNRYVYVCYVTRDGVTDGTRVSRFTVSRADVPRIDPGSETIMITWLSGGHNGGCLKFGPDGYLYISTGDAASPNPPDPFKTGQDNSDLLSAILRIDVDHADNAKAYRVPSDNPFLNMAGQRPEIWAYGFRNPWKIGFDKKSGALWAGDVGWELWELVYRVERGGNYGWSIVEGRQSIRPDGERGPTPILPPTVDHPHSEAASITGGLVYYGPRLKDLNGAYVYGDWVTGKFWALRHDGSKVTSHREVANSALQIVCFGEDQQGEMYVLDYAGGVYQFEPTVSPYDPAKFPRQLSATGLFDSVKDQAPAPGVVPFQINAEMWSDGASAERFVGLPGNSFIQTGATNVWLYQSKNEWRYPTNAVLAKTFFLSATSANPAARRPIETQVLHYDGRDWHAYSYRWNAEQTDATLMPVEGGEATYEIKDPSVSGGRRQHVWRFHSRAECLRCHNPWINFALAFSAQQLNRDVRYQANRPIGANVNASIKGGSSSTEPVISNQLRTLSHIGFFDQPLDERARPKLTEPYSLAPEADLTERARSWLHVNCAHCHREGAGGSVVSHFDYDTKLRDAKAIGFKPSQGTFGIPGASVITPGDPFNSVLYYRISKLGQGRMPHIGSSVVDVKGATLLHDWIEKVSPDLAANWTEDPVAAKLRTENAAGIRELRNASNDSAQVHADRLERILASPSGALALLHEIDLGRLNSSVVAFVIQKGMAHSNVFVRDLFERFVPEEKRARKLGSTIQPETVLSLKGDAERGRKIFFQEGGVQCYQCHRIAAQGREFGPDLTQIGKKYDRAQILEQIINPSKTIDPAFALYQVESKDDFAYSGFLLKKTQQEVVLKDATLKEIHLAADQVKLLKVSQISAMPDGLLQNMTAQEAADLIEYLSSLR